MSASPSALFDLRDHRARPTEYCRGPWHPDACHGGPVAALAAREIARADDAGAWQIARLTLELLKPVPVAGVLHLRTETERPGRKVSLLGVGVTSDGVEVARLRALRIRLGHVDLPPGANAVPDDAPPPASTAEPVSATWAPTDELAYHSHGCEHRFVKGSWDRPGPAEAWIRLAVPVVEGEEPSGVERVMAAADFGNGISFGINPARWTFINPDLTVHLLRPPQGEWVGMRTASWYSGEGAGLAESELFDEAGRVGRSCQSLLVEARPGSGAT